MNFCKKVCGVVLIGLSAFSAQAAIPTSGAFITDAQNEYVQDRLLDRIATVNMIMCFVGKFRADAFVNSGEYLALIDQQKCQSDKSSGETTSAGATGQVNYAKVYASSSRASNTAPQIVLGRILMPEENGEVTIFIKAEVTEAPSDTSLNGAFELQFEGYASNDLNTKIFQGKLVASGSTLTFYETESQGSGDRTTQLSLTQSGTSGSGRVVASGGDESSIDESFSYNASHFIRGNNSTSACFDRESDNADVSTWRYGVYNEDGTRYELSNPGFSLNYTPSTGNFAGKKVWGFASFYGIYFPNDVFATLKQDSNAVLTRPDTGATYGLSAAGGRLTKLTRNTSTLAQFKGQTARFFLDSGSSFQEFEVKWDGSQLLKVRSISFGENGQTSQPVTTNRTITAAALRSAGQDALQGYSQSLNGEIQIIVPASGEFTGETVVVYRVREAVTPSQAASLNVRCVERCPSSGASLSNPATVYRTVDGNVYNYSPVQASEVVSYSFSNGVMTHSTDGAVDASAVSNLNQGGYQFGVYSGNLFSADDLASVRCDSNGTANTGGSFVCPSLIGDLTTVYQYETGPNPWNQYIGLTPTGSATAVTFDAPKTFNLTVSTSNTNLSSGDELVGSTVVLDYQGFGSLHGIPGGCVNPETNEAGACDESSFTRYVPAFSIADGTELTSGGNLYYVKYLDREVRLSKVADSVCSGQSLTLPGGSISLPTVEAVNLKTEV
ncbi:MAG: hypothetical protein R3194_06470, partial [Limnobacter sp.]|nr:hypothetical protein [Limnobacter sp.]